MADISTKKRIWGWMAFDFATQPFYTLGLTFIFGPYFAVVAADYFLGTGMDEQTANARAQTMWSWGQGVAGVFIAFAGVLLGAYADSTGRRMPWVWVFAILYFAFTWMLWWMVPDGSNLWFALIVFSLGFIAAEFMLIFTNAQLPSLGDDEEVGKISGSGAAIGYWGGFLAFLIMIFLVAESEPGGTTMILGLDPAFGLLDADAREGTRAVGPFIAIWFAIFMIPYFLWVREVRPPQHQGGVSEAMSDLRTSLVNVVKRPSVFSFLISSMLYRDALNGLYAFGGVYAALVLGWTTFQLGIFGIISIITAAVATQISGRFDARFGPRPVIVFHIWVLIVVCVTIVGMSRETFFGMPLAEGSNLPDIVFMICGAAIGGSGGGIYAASRSMMVRHTHPERPTEAFGLFALSGKATAFLAPTLIGLFTYLLNDARLGFSPVIALFIIGMILLRWVHPDGDRAEWSKEEIPVP
ncbi:MAG: MFS transporter [Pseudomonadota bacterium]